MTHIVKLSSVVLHLRCTKYIFIQSFNKYLLDTHHVLTMYLAIYQASGTQKRSIQQYKMVFLNHHINKPCFINNVTSQHGITS